MLQTQNQIIRTVCTTPANEHTPVRDWRCAKPRCRSPFVALLNGTRRYTSATPRIVDPNMRLPLLLCAACLALSMALPAQAQWKWKDAKGQVHVSDIPPPRDVLDKDILQRPAPAIRKSGATPVATASGPAAAPASGAGSGAARTGVDPELAARKSKAEAEQKAKAKAEEDKLAQQRAENCQRARGHLAALQTGQRAVRANAQGEREVLDDKGRAEEMALARRVIDSDCR